MQFEVDPFANILTMDTMRHGCPWRFCSRVNLVRYKTLLWEPGQTGVELFLVHTGAVALYKTLPQKGSSEWMAPVAVYRRGWFLNREMLARARTHYYAVALESGEALCWTERQWFNMAYECPHMSSAISKAALRQQRYDWQLMQMHAEQKLQGVPAAELSSTRYVRASEAEDDGTVANGFRIPENLPEEVQEDVDRLHTAQVLKNFGLFAQPQHSSLLNSDGDIKLSAMLQAASLGDMHPSAMMQSASLPEMPDHFVHDLMIAFRTYCVQDSSAAPYIPSPQITEALIFAGIPKVLVTEDASATVNLSEFLVIAQHAIMAKFNHARLKALSMYSSNTTPTILARWIVENWTRCCKRPFDH